MSCTKCQSLPHISNKGGEVIIDRIYTKANLMIDQTFLNPYQKTLSLRSHINSGK
jgi:hypothetical protein